MSNDNSDCNVELHELIKNGGVYYNIKGTTPTEVYENLCSVINLPTGIDAEFLRKELVSREDLISTAVGNGIAIPHPRYPLVKQKDEHRIVVCYLEKPIHMKAPDMKPVYAMFLILSDTAKTHINILSQLAYLFQREEFQKVLINKPNEKELLDAVKKTLSDKIQKKL